MGLRGQKATLTWRQYSCWMVPGVANPSGQAPRQCVSVTYTVGSLNGTLRAAAPRSKRGEPGGAPTHSKRCAAQRPAAGAPIVDEVAELVDDDLGELAEEPDHERPRPAGVGQKAATEHNNGVRDELRGEYGSSIGARKQ